MTEEELKDKVDEIGSGTAEYLYVLDGKKVVKCNKLSDWGSLINDPKARTVAVTCTQNYRVSTTFVGMQGFEFDDDGNPLVFETMVFSDGNRNYDCYKHGTWESAQKGHLEVVSEIMNEEL